MVRGVPSAVGVAEEGALTGPAIGGGDGGQLIFGWSAQRLRACDDDAKFVAVFVTAGEFLVYQSSMLTGCGKGFRLRALRGSTGRWRTQARQRFGQTKICSGVSLHG